MPFREIDDEESHNPTCDMCEREIDLSFEGYYEFDGFNVCEDCLADYENEHRCYCAD